MPASKNDPKVGGIFFDRDGTLNHDSGYLSNPDQVILLPGVKDTIAELSKSYHLFLFTNQSGVGRGYFGMDAVEAVNNRLMELLGNSQIFTDICIAPEHPDSPIQNYRKPSPKYILETIDRFNLDPAKCYMIGDRRRDLEAAIKASIKAIRVTADIDDEAAKKYCLDNQIPSVANFSDILPIIREALH